MKTPQKTKAAYGLLGLLGAAHAIINEHLYEFDEVFGECFTGALHRFVYDAEELLEDLKGEVDEWEEDDNGAE